MDIPPTSPRTTYGSHQSSVLSLHEDDLKLVTVRPEPRSEEGLGSDPCDDAAAMMVNEQLLSPTREGLTDLIAPPKPPEVSKAKSNGMRIVWAAACAGCVAVRVLNFSSIANGLVSLGIGFSFQAAIDTGFKNKNLAQIHRVTKTLFGQLMIYGFSKMYAVGDVYGMTPLKAGAVSSILVLLGANIRAFTNTFFLQGEYKIAIESSNPQVGGEAPLRKVPSYFINSLIITSKTVATIGLAVLTRTIDHPQGQALASFFATLFGGQLAAWGMIYLLNRHIKKVDLNQTNTPGPAKGTYARPLRTFLNNLFFGGIPLVLVPYGPNADTLGRLAWFPFLGAAIGYTDEFIYRSQCTRLENFPASKLVELQVLNAPGESVYKKTPWYSCCSRAAPFRLNAYKVWRVAFPALCSLGLLGNMLYENTAYFTTLMPKFEIGAMVAGFSTFLAPSIIVDCMWSPTKRNRVLDYLMEKMILTRILGVDPLYYYVAGVNAVNLQTNSVVKPIDDQDAFTKVTATLSWFFCGAAMALEFWRIWGRRRGTVVSTFPRMLVITTSMTLGGVLRGAVKA